MNTGYIKSLDGVRALAIILVMTFHAGITHFGWMGVQLFFVLSGYLITGILWKEKFTDTSVGVKLKRFWSRRSLRIFPLYFGYLLVLGFVYLAVQFPAYYGVNIPYLITYTFNYTRTFPGWQGNPLFTHLWSLSVEEQFYLFFPFVIFFSSARFVKWILLFFIIAAPVTRFLLGGYYTGQGLSAATVADAVYWNTISHLDAFFIGGIIPVLSLQKKISQPKRWFLLFLLLVVIAGIINFLSGSGNPYLSDLGYRHGQIDNYEHVWQYTLLNFVYAAFILFIIKAAVNKQRSFAIRFLENPWLVKIGKVSYGMYLFHWSILVYGFDRFFPVSGMTQRILLFIPYLLAVYLVAAASFRFYESWFLKWKDSNLFNSKAKSIANPAPATINEMEDKH